MHLALDGLKKRPEFVLVDGNRFQPYQNLPFECIVKGDSKFASIAAASILAKTYRDDYMKSIHEQFPHYGWLMNKGYPTIEHRKKILEIGSTPHHRKSFKVQMQLDLFKG